ncbi:S1 family peptidase [Candidatus Poriferisocius sp.]|uniref:S1 family peptidase n=1 Tax=Candidatus Poriferisocius sp. TaxID=3101276 RepID=UPI003B021285
MAIALPLALTLGGGGEAPSNTDAATIARSIGMVSAAGCGKVGSGTLVLDGRYVLTNAHVVVSDSGKVCANLEVGFSDSFEEEPTTWIDATVVGKELDGLDSEGYVTLPDLAVLKLSHRVDQPSIPISAQKLDLNEDITVLGYPGIGGQTITSTEGVYAGIDHLNGHAVLKTNADIFPGNSGGAAFNSRGFFIGVPTYRTITWDQISELGWLIPAEEAASFLERHVEP